MSIPWCQRWCPRWASAVGLAVALTATWLAVGRVEPARADACPNAAFRTGVAAQLPDCRAYELVSPVDKDHTDVLDTDALTALAQVSPSGDAVAYFSPGSFAGAPQGAYANAYIGVRGPRGWSTESILPPTDPAPVFVGSLLSAILSPDLGRELVVTNATTLVPDAPDGSNLYVRDNTTGTYELVSTAAPATPPLFPQNPAAAGASSDFTHVLFSTPLALTPDAPAGASLNTYEWIAGEPLQLVGRLPDGSVEPGGVSPGGTQGYSIDHAISADGSRVFFSSLDSATTPRLYVRQNGMTTEISPAGQFWTATADGSEVLFTDAAGIERYDVATGTTTNLSPDDDPSDGTNSQVDGIVGASADLSRVYFVARGLLLPGQGTAGARNLYLSDNGTVAFIGTLDPNDYFTRGLASASGFPNSGQRAMTADGRELAFASSAQLTSYDNAGHTEVYLYVDGGDLTCVSCNRDEPQATGDALLNGTFFPLGSGSVAQLLPTQRNFTADGRRLFFQTTEALAPRDTNGTADVYEWDDGEVHLISSGQGAENAHFMAVSPSGDDVFFTTREQLVTLDQDQLTDLYDARVDGGLAAQNPPSPPLPCAGDECHGQPQAAPTVSVPGSVSFAGPGNILGRTPAALRFTVAKISGSAQRRFAATGRLVLAVKVTGKAKVSASALARLGGRLRTVASGSAASGRAATVKVALRLSPAARRQLSKHKALGVRIQVRVAGVPGGGGAGSWWRAPPSSRARRPPPAVHGPQVTR